MGNGIKGSNTTQSYTAPNPTAQGYYNNVLAQASNAAAAPYVPYGGQEVAPINEQQQAGFGNINAAQPGFQAGVGQIQSSTQPISASDIANYESPYTKDVINATQADFAHQNAETNANTVGNAGAQNVLGGDRVAVAQALNTEAENRTQAPVIAGLENTGFLPE